MRAWVRYSVAVYIGLLLAGSLMPPKPEAVAQDSTPPAPLRDPAPALTANQANATAELAAK